MPEQQPLIPEIIDPDDAEIKPNAGNGRPRGARGRKFAYLRKIVADNQIALIDAVVRAAIGGDMIAAKILIDRYWPRPRTAPVEVDIAELRSPGDLRNAMIETAEKVFAGEITPDQGADVISILRDIISAHSVTIATPQATEQPADIREMLYDRMRRAAEAQRKMEQEETQIQ